jgi:hypothetical protein
VFALATDFAMRHTLSLGIRTMDILHVAAACHLGADSFVAFDKIQPGFRDWLRADFAKASSRRTLDFAEAHLVVRRAQRTMRGC